MKPPEPTLTIDLFPELLEALLGLLKPLSADEWNRPTACLQTKALETVYIIQ